MERSPGPADVFRRLFEEHVEDMKLYCLRRLYRHEVDDAVADIFTVAWRRRDDLPVGDGELPYLYGIARNIVRNHRRGDRRRVRLARRVQAERIGSPPSPEAQVVMRHEERQVLAAMELLHPDDRELLRLHAWEELSRSDIAAVFGISPAAAGMRLNRATKRLARSLRSIGFDEEVSVGPRAAGEGGTP